MQASAATLPPASAPAWPLPWLQYNAIGCSWWRARIASADGLCRLSAWLTLLLDGDLRLPAPRSTSPAGCRSCFTSKALQPYPPSTEARPQPVRWCASHRARAAPHRPRATARTTSPSPIAASGPTNRLHHRHPCLRPKSDSQPLTHRTNPPPLTQVEDRSTQYAVGWKSSRRSFWAP